MPSESNSHMPDIDHGLDAMTETTTPAELMKRRGQRTKLRTINKDKLKQWIEQAIAQSRAGMMDGYGDREKEELLQKTQQQLEDLMARAAKAEAAVRDREERDANLENEIAELRTQAATAASSDELDRAMATIETLTQQRDEAQQEGDDLRADLYQLQDQLNEKITLLATTIEEKDKLNHTIRELMGKSSDLAGGVLRLDQDYYGGRHQQENALPEEVDEAEADAAFYHDYEVGAKVIETLAKDLARLREITRQQKEAEASGAQPSLLEEDLELLAQLKAGNLMATDVAAPIEGLIEALSGVREEAIAESTAAAEIMGLGAPQQTFSELPDPDEEPGVVLAGATRFARELATAFVHTKGRVQALKALADDAEERGSSNEDLAHLDDANRRLIDAIIAHATAADLVVPEALTDEEVPSNERAAAGEALVRQFAGAQSKAAESQAVQAIAQTIDRALREAPGTAADALASDAAIASDDETPADAEASAAVDLADELDLDTSDADEEVGALVISRPDGDALQALHGQVEDLVARLNRAQAQLEAAKSRESSLMSTIQALARQRSAQGDERAERASMKLQAMIAADETGIDEDAEAVAAEIVEAFGDSPASIDQALTQELIQAAGSDEELAASEALAVLEQAAEQPSETFIPSDDIDDEDDEAAAPSAAAVVDPAAVTEAGRALVRQLGERRDTLSVELEAAQERIQELEAQVADADQQRIALGETQAAQQALAEQVASAEATRQELENRLTEADSARQELENRLAETDSARQELADRVAEGEAAREELSQQLTEASNQQQAVTEQLAAARDQHSRAKAESEAQIASLEGQIQQLEAQIHEGTSRFESTSAAAAATEEAKQELAAQVAQLEAEKAELEQERDDMAESGREVIQQLTAQREQRDREIEVLKTRITTLDRLNREFIESVGDMADVAEQVADREDSQVREAAQELESALGEMPGEAGVPLSEPAAEHLVEATRKLANAFKEELAQAFNETKEMAAGSKDIIEVLSKRADKLSDENQQLQSDYEAVQAKRLVAEKARRELAETIASFGERMQGEDETVIGAVADLEVALSDEVSESDADLVDTARQVMDHLAQVGAGSEIQQRLAALESEVTTATTAAAAAEERYHEQLAAKQTETGDLMRELEELREERERLYQQVDEWQDRGEADAKTLQNLRDELEAARQELERAREKLAADKKSMQLLREENAAAVAERSHLREQIDRISEEHATEVAETQSAMANRLDEMETRLETAQATIDVLRDELDETSLAKRQASEELAELQVAQQQLDEQHAALVADHGQLTDQLATERQALAELRDAHAAVCEERDRLREEAAELGQQIASLTGEHEELRHQQEQRATAQAQQLDEIMGANQGLYADLEEERERNSELVARSEALAHTQTELEERIAGFKDEVATLRSELQAVRTTRAELEVTAQRVADEREALEAQYQATTRDLDELLAAHQALEDEHQASQQQLGERISALEQDLAGEQRHVAELEEQLGASRSENDGLRDQVAERDRELERLAGLETDLATVRSDLETERSHLSEVGAARDALQAQLDGLREEHDQQREALAETSHERDRLKQLLKEARAAIEEYRARDAESSSGLDETLTDLRRRLSELQQERDRLQSQADSDLEDRDIEISALRKQLSDQHQAVAGRDEEILKLKGDLDQVGDVRVHNAEMAARIERLSEDLAKANARSSDLEAQVNELVSGSGRAGGLAEELQLLQSEREQLLGRVRSLEDDIAIERGRVTGLQEARDKQRLTFDEERQDLQERFESEYARHETAQEQIRKLKSELAGLQARVRTLTSADDDYND